MSDRAFLSRVICLIVAAHSRIQMLVRCILMRGSRRVRKSRDVRLCIILAVSDDLALHAHACVVRVQMPGRPASWLTEGALAATHLE